MLGLTRRRVLSGVAASVISGALVLSLAPPAAAVVVVPPPVIPAAAESVGGAICALTGVETGGIGCLLAGAGVLAVGAYFAWAGGDQLLQATDNWLGQPNNDTVGTSNTGWPGNWYFANGAPDPAAGPLARVANDGNFTVKCDGYCLESSSGSVQCVSPSGAVSSWSVGVGRQYGGSISGDIIGTNCQSPNKVAEFTLTWGTSGTGVLFWHAGGGWDAIQTSTTTTTCKIPGGGTTTVSSTVTGTVTSARSFTVKACPSGSYAQGITVTSGPAGGSQHTVATWGGNTSVESTYPNCFTGSTPGYGACGLVVKYQGTPCDSSVSACQDWYSMSSADGVSYSCLWGPYTMPLSSCLPMRYAYLPGSSIDPATHLPAPAPTPTPSASATTGGGTFPSAGTNPNPAPSSSTWYSQQPFPSTSGQPVPEPPPTVGPAPGSANCMDAVWGWNPINWVVVPVECALTWAFVPDGAVMQQTVTDMGNHWHASATGTFVDGAFGMFATLGNLTAGDAQACGLVVDFPYAHGHTQELRLLDSCTAPMSTYAPWVKGFLTAMLLFDGIYACVRALGIGFGIGVPPKMGQLDLFSQN